MSRSVLPPFAALRAFVAVGRQGGIRKAADALGVSHAIVSRHISSLEQQFGMLLFDRETGQLTEAGRRYHPQISRAIADMEVATEALLAARRTGLTIWCSPGFALHWLTRRLPAFSSVRDGLVIDLRSTDSEPAFERGEADGDIRYVPDYARQAQPRGVRLLELARPPVFPVAAPQLLARLQKIDTISQLIDLPLIHETDDREWKSWFAAQGIANPPLKAPVARYGQAHLTVAAARAEQGVALTNPFLVAEDLAAGRLAKVEIAHAPLRSVALGAYVFRSSHAKWSEPGVAKFRNWLKSSIMSDMDLTMVG